MRLINAAGRAALRTDAGDLDVERASGGRFGPDPQDLYAVWDEFRSWAEGVDDESAGPAVAADVLGSPVPRPAQVFAVGLNYRSHAEETGLAGSPGVPLTFTKFPSSIAGPVGELVLSGDEVDWEVELVAVIGRTAHRVAPEKAWDHVAGLTVGQDFSDRRVQMEGSPPQFALGKSFPGYAPLGPVLVTPDELDDPDDLRLTCTIDGVAVQDGRTSAMIHSVPQLVSLLSGICPLGPGDVIFTGTQDGVGMGRTPVRYLRPGEVVESTVEGIGSLWQRCVAGGEVA
jgi:2-keto-4-pentenoate hydratase/2-oxohepta-3-ene-1,7-dioic acid hydratase in catechol pathway